MGLTKLFSSSGLRQVSSLSMLLKAAVSLRDGNKKHAALFIVAAVLAYQYTVASILIEIGTRLYRHR